MFNVNVMGTRDQANKICKYLNNRPDLRAKTVLLEDNGNAVIGCEVRMRVVEVLYVPCFTERGQYSGLITSVKGIGCYFTLNFVYVLFLIAEFGLILADLVNVCFYFRS